MTRRDQSNAKTTENIMQTKTNKSCSFTESGPTGSAFQQSDFPQIQAEAGIK